MDELRRTNDYLREIVATRDEEIRRRDVIISQLTSRIPELTAGDTPTPSPAPAQASEEGAQEPAESGEGPPPAPRHCGSCGL